MTQRPKTEAEIQAMRDGGKILATIFRDLRAKVQPGVSEKELDEWVASEIHRHGAIATYRTSEVNFPASICISVNEQIVHSIPTDYILEKGDVVSFDLVITYNGMKTDSAFTMVVGGEPSAAQKHLIAATERSLYAASMPSRVQPGLAISALQSKKSLKTPNSALLKNWLATVLATKCMNLQKCQTTGARGLVRCYNQAIRLQSNQWQRLAVKKSSPKTMAGQSRLEMAACRLILSTRCL